MLFSYGPDYTASWSKSEPKTEEKDEDDVDEDDEGEDNGDHDAEEEDEDDDGNGAAMRPTKLSSADWRGKTGALLLSNYMKRWPGPIKTENGVNHDRIFTRQTTTLTAGITESGCQLPTRHISSGKHRARQTQATYETRMTSMPWMTERRSYRYKVVSTVR